jgi:hypothetical protein
MAVVYAAHTEACTLMLDENGICEWAAPTGRGRVPDRIVGAQFVASLDVSAPGALVGEPREGVPMLFASKDEEGHISLIRTANLVRWDDRRDNSGIVRTAENPRRSLRPSLDDLAPRGRRSSIPPAPQSEPPSPKNNYAPPPAPGQPKGTPDVELRSPGVLGKLPSSTVISSRRTARHRR